MFPCCCYHFWGRCWLTDPTFPTDPVSDITASVVQCSKEMTPRPATEPDTASDAYDHHSPFGHSLTRISSPSSVSSFYYSSTLFFPLRFCFPPTSDLHLSPQLTSTWIPRMPPYHRLDWWYHRYVAIGSLTSFSVWDYKFPRRSTIERILCYLLICHCKLLPIDSRLTRKRSPEV